MKVTVLYFASVREIAGTAEDTIELEAGARAQDLLDLLAQIHPELKGLAPSLAISVNQQYAAPEAPLADGDEVALIPPVSGGASTPAGTYEIVERPIGLDEVARIVRRDSSGAVAASRRREALGACSYSIERLKEIVPIWKKEAFEDGEVWVGHHGSSWESLTNKKL